MQGTKLKEKSNGTEVVCKTERGAKVTMPKDELYMFTYVYFQPGCSCSFCWLDRDFSYPRFVNRQSSLLNIEDDVVMLDFINPAQILFALKERYKKHEIYTWVGAAKSVLIRLIRNRGCCVIWNRSFRCNVKPGLRFS